MRDIDRIHGLHNEREAETADQREARCFTAAKNVLDSAWEHSPECRARLEGAGIAPGDVTDYDAWTRIPVLRKKAIIDFQKANGLKGMLSCEVGQLRRIYMSPGPIFDPEARSADHWGWTEAFHAAGFRANDVVQMTFSYHLTPAGLMLEEPLRELGCAVVPAGPGNTAVQIDIMSGLPTNGFVGMASYLRVIADKAAKCGKPVDLDVAFVAAERLSAELRSGLEQDLGMLVRQGYGTADVGCIAYECPELTGMHLSTRCLVEICDPATGLPMPAGETGEVVVTPFVTDYPLVRLATGDLSYLATDACACGRTAPRLGGIVGRVDDTAKVKGQFIYPHQVADVVAGFPQVERWQVVVDNPGGRDTIAIRLALSGGDVTPDFESAFVAAFQAECKLRPAILAVDSASEIDENGPALVDNRTFD